MLRRCNDLGEQRSQAADSLPPLTYQLEFLVMNYMSYGRSSLSWCGWVLGGGNHPDFCPRPSLSIRSLSETIRLDYTEVCVF